MGGTTVAGRRRCGLLGGGASKGYVSRVKENPQGGTSGMRMSEPAMEEMREMMFMVSLGRCLGSCGRASCCMVAKILGEYQFNQIGWK